MTDQRVAIVAGARRPFVKAGQVFARLGPLLLAQHAVRGLLERHQVDPAGIDALAFGVVVAEPGKPNLARENEKVRPTEVVSDLRVAPPGLEPGLS
jgi:acetyl-CoA acetyltransferase